MAPEGPAAEPRRAVRKPSRSVEEGVQGKGAFLLGHVPKRGLRWWCAGSGRSSLGVAKLGQGCRACRVREVLR